MGLQEPDFGHIFRHQNREYLDVILTQQKLDLIIIMASLRPLASL